jgi:putative membrane protein
MDANSSHPLTDGQSASPERTPRRQRIVGLLRGGREPDPRFTLANERTFLAWIRTALALQAGGIAVVAFTPGVFLPEVWKLLSITLLALGLFVSASACLRWLNVERAMRLGKPLPLPLLVPLLSIGVAVVAAGLTVFVVMRQS